MMIPVELPIKQDSFLLQVWDEDKVIDELCCSVHLSFKSMLKYSIEEPHTKWINLYGAPMGFSGSTCDRMNADPSVASEWKGRILV